MLQPTLPPFAHTIVPPLGETYFDLLIASDAHFHRDYTSGAVLADMRILGPGVTMPGASPKKKQDGPRLTPKEKLALQSANAATLRLPGALTCAAGDVFNYSRYNSTVKLLSQAAPTYAPKRRTLAWTVRLIQEIYDERYKRDTSDIGGGEEFEEMDEERVAAARAKEEVSGEHLHSREHAQTQTHTHMYPKHPLRLLLTRPLP